MNYLDKCYHYKFESNDMPLLFDKTITSGASV